MTGQSGAKYENKSEKSAYENLISSFQAKKATATHIISTNRYHKVVCILHCPLIAYTTKTFLNFYRLIFMEFGTENNRKQKHRKQLAERSNIHFILNVDKGVCVRICLRSSLGVMIHSKFM